MQTYAMTEGSARWDCPAPQTSRLRQAFAAALALSAILSCAAAASAQSLPSPSPYPINDVPAKPVPQMGATAGAPRGAGNAADFSTAAYIPITPQQRVRWALIGPLWPRNLLAGVFVAGFGTALNLPHEYGPHWEGFADRYGIRIAGLEVQNSMEVSLGAIWGEDPRYFPLREGAFKARLHHVVIMTFAARRSDGSLAPAYARYAAIPGSNFLSNAWRVHSEANTEHALLRTAEGFAGRMIGDAYREFWPDVSARLRHRRANE